MYKPDLELDSLQWLICHKPKSSQTNASTTLIFTHAEIVWFLYSKEEATSWGLCKQLASRKIKIPKYFQLF